MDYPGPNNVKRIISLVKASEMLGVSIETLLSWNEHDILKPTVTQDGQIGYTEEQLNRFLSIRQQLATTQTSPTLTQEYPKLDIPEERYIQNEDIIAQNMKNPPKSQGGFPVLGLIAFLILSASVAVITATKQSVKTNQGGIKEISSKTSNYNFSQPAIFSQWDSISQEKKVNTIEDAILDKKITSLSEIFSPKTQNNSSTVSKSGKQVPTKTVLGKVKNQSLVDNPEGASSQVNLFASTTADNNDSVFDNKGNIKQEKGQKLNSSLLAHHLGPLEEIHEDVIQKQNIDLNILFGFFGLILLWAVFGLKRQFVYPVQKSNPVIIPADSPKDSEEKKVLELEQKKDGSVVVIFHGKEHRISKPELDSESDQFISRLMEISDNTKEIDYDSLKDERLQLYAPLSKLVTRLGFVGVKRDLFFPRTSKSRVLFRRYLTENDLISMNLAISDISSDFFRNI